MKINEQKLNDNNFIIFFDQGMYYVIDKLKELSIFKHKHYFKAVLFIKSIKKGKTNENK